MSESIAIHAVAQDNPWRAKSPSVADARAVHPYMQDATLNEEAVYFAKVYIYLPISVYNPILFRISLSENIHHGAITYRGVAPSQTIFFQKRFANSK